MARPRLNRPTDAELQILAILWRQGARTIREIHVELKKLRGSGYNSALKLVQIMHDKGLVNKNATGYPQTFTAAVSRSATERLLVKDLLTRGGERR